MFSGSSSTTSANVHETIDQLLGKSLVWSLMGVMFAVHLLLSTFMKYVEVVGINLNLYMVTTALGALLLLHPKSVGGLVTHIRFVALFPAMFLLGMFVIGYLQANLFGLPARSSIYILFGVKAAVILVTTLMTLLVPRAEVWVLKVFGVLALLSASLLIIQVWISVDVSPYHILANLNLAQTWAVFEGYIRTRGNGLARSPGDFAVHQFIAMFMLIMVYRYRRWTVVWTGVLLVIAYAAMLNETESAYIGLLAGLIYLWVVRRSELLTRSPALFALAVVLSLYVVSYLLIIIFLNYLDMGSFSVISRLYLWDMGFEIWRQNPWIGIGAGGYNIDLVDSVYIYLEGSITPRSAHSDLFDLAASMGAAGVMLYVGFAYSTVYLAVSSYRKSRSEFDLLIGGAFLATISLGLFGTLYHAVVTHYVLAGIVAGRYLRVRSVEEHREIPRAGSVDLTEGNNLPGTGSSP